MTETIDASSRPEAAIHVAIAAMLDASGQPGQVGQDESLFLSGKLDSLAAAELLGLLESSFGVDPSDLDFDIREIDTLARIEALVRRNKP